MNRRKFCAFYRNVVGRRYDRGSRNGRVRLQRLISDGPRSVVARPGVARDAHIRLGPADLPHGNHDDLDSVAALGGS